MGSSINRNLQRKYEKSKRQVREAAHAEFSKSSYLARKPIIPPCDGVTVRRFATGLTASASLRSHF